MPTGPTGTAGYPRAPRRRGAKGVGGAAVRGARAASERAGVASLAAARGATARAGHGAGGDGGTCGLLNPGAGLRTPRAGDADVVRMNTRDSCELLDWIAGAGGPRGRATGASARSETDFRNPLDALGSPSGSVTAPRRRSAPRASPAGNWRPGSGAAGAE